MSYTRIDYLPPFYYTYFIFIIFFFSPFSQSKKQKERISCCMVVFYENLAKRKSHYLLEGIYLQQNIRCERASTLFQAATHRDQERTSSVNRKSILTTFKCRFPNHPRLQSHPPTPRDRDPKKHPLLCHGIKLFPKEAKEEEKLEV